MSQFFNYLMSNYDELLLRTVEHLYISLAAIAISILVAIPLGIILTRIPKAADSVIGIVGMIQTVPALAILAFAVPIFGVGKITAIIALFFYSMLPILRNAYTSVKDVDESLLEAGRGMGMNEWERIFHVELPLAFPVIMAGTRVSTVFLISWATLASYIGAGGLGSYIFSGMSEYRPDLILMGAIPVTLLALLVDFVLGRVEKWLTPKGLQNSSEEA